MANNPYVNKVVYGNSTLIDLTSDTVSPDKVLSGETFHNAAGERKVGTLTVPDELQDLTGDVDISTPSDGQALVYNGTTHKWENKNISASSGVVQPFKVDPGYYGQTLNITKDGTALTPVTIPSTGELTLFFDALGTYTYTCTATYGFTFTTSITYRYMRQYDSIEIYGKAPFYPWETITESQLADVLRSYYGGAYDENDIATLKTTYFPIGAKRTLSLSAMVAGDNCQDAHHADDYQFTIIGFEHDTLAEPSSGGKTKALLTLQQDRILYKNTVDSTYSSNYPSIADEGGQMNQTNTNVGGWKSSQRRGWCNNTYRLALPAYIKNLIKVVVKSTTKGSQSTVLEDTDDSVFLLSEYEIFGAKTYSANYEGTQYDYYKTASNRYKKPSYSSYASAYWWERSPYVSSATRFCYVNNNGGADYGNASNANGLAPAFCI